LELITDLLDLAKIEAGKMEVRSEPLSLRDLFEGLISIIKPLAEKKDLSVIPTVGRDVPIMQSDPAKLQQVLYNFLSNAIKFSPMAGRIDVKAERFEEDIRADSVSDPGPHRAENRPDFRNSANYGSVTRRTVARDWVWRFQRN
jgi:signal transduction histidine kinase